MNTDASPTFGVLLKTHRLAHGLSQEQLAERAGVTAQAVGALERGFRRTPYRDTVRALAHALALDPAETAAIEAAVLRGRAAAPEAPEMHHPMLPLPPTPLVGREWEVAEVAALLHRTLAGAPVRLLTLMGPGGVGKTRLALAVAHAVTDRYSDAAVFIPLAPLRDAALVPAAIAHVLRVKEDPDCSLLEALCRQLRAKRVLLLLDNFEHVVAAAPVITELLAACAGLRVLVTSRTRLHLRGEHLFLVPPLRVPAPVQTLSLTELAEVPAVALLVASVQACAGDFALNASTAPAIAALCARLDGLPLALELVAPRLATLSPAMLLDRLSSRLRLLTDGSRDLPTRQQTLRATLEWSYALLSPGEQVAFRRLSVFPASHTLEAAEDVCMASSAETTVGDALLAARDITEWVSGLVNQSLLYRDRTPEDSPRFAMLETVREFGLERLEESGEAAHVHRHHADATRRMVEIAAQALSGPHQGAALTRLERERDNVRAALDWARGRQDRLRMGRLVSALWRFWLARGSIDEGRRWLAEALALQENHEDAGSLARTRMLIGAAMLAIAQGAVEEAEALVADAITGARGQGDDLLLVAALNAGGDLARRRGEYPEATAYHEEALALARACGDVVSIADTLVGLGYAASLTGDTARGALCYEESLPLARQAGNSGGIAGTLIALAWQAFHRSEYARVDALAGEALDLFRALGDAGRTAEALWLLGITAQHEGDFSGARARHAESLALRRARGDERGVAQSLSALMQILLWQGDVSGARERAMDVLAILRRSNDRWPLAMALTLLGHVELAAGEVAQARAVLGESMVIFREIGNPLYLPWCLEGMAGVAVARGQPVRAARLLGAGAALHRHMGSSLPAAHPAGDARTRAAIHALLGDVAFAAARANGGALPLDDVIADALEATQ